MATITSTLPARRSRGAEALHLWHLTSLDAVTVAVAWTLAVAWAAGLRLPWWPPAVVGLSAWTCYIADRLFDAHRATTPLRPRHHFHWHHRRVFVPLAIVSGVAALALVVWKMPLHAELRDSLIAAAAIAYFTSVHATEASSPRHSRLDTPRPRRRIPKELLVAVVFTAACAAPAFTRSSAHLPLLPVLAAFIATAWLNCHAIESWESWSPEAADSVRPAAQCLACATLIGAFIAAFLHFGHISLLLLAAASSAALLAFLDRHREHLSPITLRALADLVLLTPLALVMLP